MTTSARTRAIAVMVAAMAACGSGGGRGPVVLVPSATAPAEVRAACELTVHRCSRCHTLDRVIHAPASAPDYWRVYVRRMRLTPGSGIRPDEEPPILRCLLYRSFGASTPETAGLS
jgi:hypothetical protein